MVRFARWSFVFCKQSENLGTEKKPKTWLFFSFYCCFFFLFQELHTHSIPRTHLIPPCPFQILATCSSFRCPSCPTLLSFLTCTHQTLAPPGLHIPCTHTCPVTLPISRPPLPALMSQIPSSPLPMAIRWPRTCQPYGRLKRLRFSPWRTCSPWPWAWPSLLVCHPCPLFLAFLHTLTMACHTRLVIPCHTHPTILFLSKQRAYTHRAFQMPKIWTRMLCMGLLKGHIPHLPMPLGYPCSM